MLFRSQQLPVTKMRRSQFTGDIFAGAVDPFGGNLTNGPVSAIRISDKVVWFSGVNGNVMLTTYLWNPSADHIDDPFVPPARGGVNYSTVLPPNVNMNFYSTYINGEIADYVNFQVTQSPGTDVFICNFNVAGPYANYGAYGSFVVDDANNPSGTYYATGTCDEGTFNASIAFAGNSFNAGFTTNRMFTASDDGAAVMFLHLDNSGNQTWNTTP